MDKFLRITGLVSLILLGASILTFSTYDGLSDEDFTMVFNEKYGIFALNVPEDVYFAGEYVPMNDPGIFERYDHELLVNTYWQSHTLLYFKRSNRYFKIIEPILKKNNIPEDFKYLALVESGFENVVSPVGATGFWQIMEETGKSYGLEINKEVDERYHLEKSTEAACRYLEEAYEELGSWTLAAASYNMGIAGVKKQLKRQEAESYYGLTLNTETERYLFRILAAKEILENPETYGFNFREKDLYEVIPTRTVVIDSSVTNFGKFARGLGINYRILKYHNPWLRYDYLPNSTGKRYEIKIPKEGYYELAMPEVNSDNLDTTKPSPPAISDTVKVDKK